MKRLLRLAEAAEILSISPRGVYRLLGSGQLPGIKIMGGVRIDRTDLDIFIGRKKKEFSLEYGFCDSTCQTMTD